MNEGQKLLIVEDYGADTITIYWRNRTDSMREEWYYFEDSKMMGQTYERGEAYAPQSRKPLFVFPFRMGQIFLELIGAEINKNGYNKTDKDKQLGKAEILESELAFSKEQLVKFIDHFTTKQQ